MDDIDGLFLTKEKFISVLQKIHLAEAKFELNKINNKEKAELELNIEYQEIYIEYNINQKDFLKTLNYYLERPEELEIAYSEILENLKDRQLSLQ